MVFSIPGTRYVFNWRSFFLQRDKFYTGLWRVHNTAACFLIAYLLWVAGYTYSNNVNRLWVHYSRKERERIDLYNLINEARDTGRIGPSKFDRD